MNVVKRLFKIQNINASTIRTVMVAHCRRHDSPDLLLDYEAQSQAQAQAQRTQQHQPLFFDLGNTDSEEEEDEHDEDEEDEERGEKRVSAHLPTCNPSGIQHVIHVRTIEIAATTTF